MKKEYKNPALTTDIVIFSIKENNLQVLLIERKYEPFKNKWAIPGGFVDYDEELDMAAKRELEEETSVKDIYLEQLRTFGRVGRDPRGRTVSVVYFACVNYSNLNVKAQDDARDARWFNVKALPELAFDHQEIMDFALENLRRKIENTPVVSEFLPEKFSLEELQQVYEIILDKKLDKEKFANEVSRMSFIEKLDEFLYRFRDDIKFSSRFC